MLTEKPRNGQFNKGEAAESVGMKSIRQLEVICHLKGGRKVGLAKNVVFLGSNSCPICFQLFEEALCSVLTVHPYKSVLNNFYRWGFLEFCEELKDLRLYLTCKLTHF